jgi:hypothetical protein
MAVIAYAGKTSLANVHFGLLADVSFAWTATISVSGLSIALYLRERRAHRRTIERLSPRITERELKIDPNRTSSQLTREGRTQRGDE